MGDTEGATVQQCNSATTCQNPPPSDTQLHCCTVALLHYFSEFSIDFPTRQQCNSAIGPRGVGGATVQPAYSTVGNPPSGGHQ